MKIAYGVGSRVKGFTLIRVIKEEPLTWLCEGPDGAQHEITDQALRRRATQARSRADAALARIVADYAYRCRKRGVAWELSFEQVRSLIFSPCEYCLIPPSNIQRGHLPTSGIDRKDNLRGYWPDNCVACCKTCNAVKSSLLTHEEMKVAMRAIVEYRRLKIGY